MKKEKKIDKRNVLKDIGIVLVATMICVAFATMVSATSDGGSSVDTVNDTTKDKLNDTNQDLGFPNVVITTNDVSPFIAIPGSTTRLYVTVSEIDGVDWAKDVTVFVDILNPDGTSFVETGTSHAERYLGRIDRYSSEPTSFAINVPNSAWLGYRNIRTTVEYYETGFFDFGTTGPYYVQSDTSFTVENPSIEVTSPNGGEIWARGTPNTITWSSTGDVGANVKIELLKNNIPVGTVTPGTPNGGSHSWTISPTRALGSDYKIRVTSISNPAISDTSDNNFIIGGINVNSPNGGENWAKVTSHAITWSKLGNSGPNVRIDLLKNNAIVGTVTSDTPNDGSHPWTISSTRALGSDYKIRVTSTSDSRYKDTSNNNFNIIATSDRLNPGDRLVLGQYIISPNGLYKLRLQMDSNLVLTTGTRALWASGTNGRGASSAIMQNDGNFVIYGPSGAIWSTNTPGHPGARLVVQNDGRVIVYQGGTPLWIRP